VRILLNAGAVSAPELLRGEWWRLAASAFVHIGAVHLLANLLMLAVLGSVSERIWGRGRFAAIYLGSALVGAAAAMAIRPLTEGAPAVVAGAAGAHAASRPTPARPMAPVRRKSRRVRPGFIAIRYSLVPVQSS